MSAIIVFYEILLLMVNLISATLSDIMLYFVLANDGKYCVAFEDGAIFVGPVTFEAGSLVGAFLSIYCISVQLLFLLVTVVNLAILGYKLTHLRAICIIV